MELVGLIIPHEGGFASHLTEKIEDLVTTLFVPSKPRDLHQISKSDALSMAVYFALSGLRTNLALLNDGITWVRVDCRNWRVGFSQALCFVLILHFQIVRHTPLVSSLSLSPENLSGVQQQPAFAAFPTEKVVRSGVL